MPLPWATEEAALQLLLLSILKWWCLPVKWRTYREWACPQVWENSPYVSFTGFNYRQTYTKLCGLEVEYIRPFVLHVLLTILKDSISTSLALAVTKHAFYQKILTVFSSEDWFRFFEVSVSIQFLFFIFITFVTFEWEVKFILSALLVFRDD